MSGLYFQATYYGLEESQQSAERPSWGKMMKMPSVDARQVSEP